MLGGGDKQLDQFCWIAVLLSCKFCNFCYAYCEISHNSKKPNDPLLTSRWSLLKCLSFKKKFASEIGILLELDPKQDSGFSLNLQISDFK